MSADTLERFVFERARVRGELVCLDQAWQEVLRRRPYPPSLRAALGELMAACTLLTATLKFSTRALRSGPVDTGGLVLQIQGGGPVTLLVVECQSDLSLRATATYEDLGGLAELATLRGLTSGGRCVLTIDPGPGMQAYQSVVPLEGATVTEALERFMGRSEQLPTAFRLAADERRAVGLLLQRLPEQGGYAQPADDGLWDGTAAVMAGLTPADLLALPGAELLRRMFHGQPLRVFESVPVRFACRCSRERVAGVIRMIGAAEARGILAELGRISVVCEFCQQDYVFDRGQTEAALTDQTAATPPPA